MNMRIFLLVVGCALSVGGCVSSAGNRPFAGTLPSDTHVDMAGTFTFLPESGLQLALTTSCYVARSGLAVDCARPVLDNIQVIAHTPWNQDIRGTWSDAQHIAFRVDWKATGLDPLADDATTVVARRWIISGTEWSPTSAEAAMILRLIGAATETEPELVRGGKPPNLEVTTFEIDGEALHPGTPGTLLVRVTNRGSGAAYRVVATTRSSVDALHGQRLSFGLIKPGADKIRKLQVTVPASETARDTMLVLAVSEGNGFAPHNISRRIAIAPSAAAPVLAVRCTVDGHREVPPAVDAGESLKLRCTVDNTGDAAARLVELEVSVAGSAPGRSKPQVLDVAKRLTFDVPTVIPNGIPIGAPVEIAITARDRQSSRTTSTKVVGVMRKPTLCVPGQLTRAQYQSKLANLRATRDAGGLTQEQFDGYDAELTSCLKVK